MKKLFSVMLFMSTTTPNAFSKNIDDVPCSEKAAFTAHMITAEYEDANFFEVYFYAYQKCIGQTYLGEATDTIRTN